MASKKSLPNIKQALQQLVASPSISSVSPQFDQSNLGVIDLLAQWFADLGFTIEIIPLEENKNKANMIATLGSGEGGLVLAGHTDTVPYDEDRWQSDPFKLLEQSQRFYGLGVTDMKGFFALILQALIGVDLTKLSRPLVIVATADEESTMDGAKMLLRLGKPLANFAVIGEPTGLKPVRMHKGMMMEAIHIKGRAGHSSDPALGVNAIDGLSQVLQMLSRWRGEIQSRYINTNFKVPFPTLNFGLVAGGDNPNRICAHSELHFDLRLLPGMSTDDIRNQLDSKLSQLQQTSELKFIRVPLIEGTPPFETDAASPLVRFLEILSGQSAQSVAFCTEGPYFQQLGMETVVWGPGNIEQAHQPNEFLNMDALDPCIHALQKLIVKYCAGDE